jgi:hypothetical protein
LNYIRKVHNSITFNSFHRYTFAAVIFDSLHKQKIKNFINTIIYIMKTVGKIKMAFAFAITMIFASNVQAQETKEVKNYDQGFRLGVGLNAGYALNDPYKLALGADARLQYDLTKRYSLTLITGFTNLFVSEADRSDLGFIPAKAGFKAFVWNDEFYVMGEAGAAFAVTNGYNKTSLLLAPSIIRYKIHRHLIALRALFRLSKIE